MLAAVAPLPPSEPPPRSRLIPATWAGRIGLFALTWGVAMTGISLVSGQGPAPVNRPIKEVSKDYVSSDSCRGCHPGNYASWHASYHRTMTQVASPKSILSDLHGLKLTYDSLDYSVEQKGESFYVRTKPEGAPDSAYTKPLEIVLLTGSHTLQIYWMETGDARTLGQFPFAYIVAEKKWTPMVQTFLVPPGPKHVYTKGDWNNVCMNCHVTQGRSRFVEGHKFDSQVSDFGIACEACHSGGKEHVAANRNPARRFALHWSGAKDSTIANPARMSAADSSLVCGQCHSIWTYNNTQDTITWNRQGGDYRPGDKELDLRWVVQQHDPAHDEKRKDLLQSSPHFFDDSYWGDGMVRVIGREYNGVLGSPCFKGGKFSCLSCHDMHPDKTDSASLAEWRNDQLKPGMSESNQACLQCHGTMSANVPAHTHHAADSPGSSCYNCHMPHTSYGLLRATRSHQISSPAVIDSLKYGRPNACNLCHLDRTLEWTADNLAKWYGQEKPELSADDRELSAAVQWLLKGDAGQRALISWNMGWAPAQKASGHEWLYPFLIFQLNDPYATDRFVAWKSLQTLPGFYGYEYDYTVEDAQQKEALSAAYQKWWQEVRKNGYFYKRETLLEPTGYFRQATFDRLLNQRNNRKIYLAE